VRRDAQPDETAERAWVERFLASREESAFLAIYRAHAGYLFRLAVRLCGGRRDAAEDALQDAWLRAARGLRDFRWGARLRTWLAGIVINCCREQRRRAAREAPVPEPTPLEPGVGARLDLEAAVLSLPEGLRDVVVLHVIEGYTHEEIGGLLGIAAGTSKTRLFDARAALRRRLARDEGAVS
jgi:RNA polymerase sigma-70 factor, ECF subfamily